MLKDKEMMAGAGMGNMFYGLLGWGIINGFNGALDTLVSQAAGMQEYELCGIYLHRGRLLTFILFIPAALIFMNVESILRIIIDNEMVARHAQAYLNYNMFAFFIISFDDL